MDLAQYLPAPSRQPVKYKGPAGPAINQFQVVTCRYCGKVSIISDVQFRCPQCKVFLDGPISIATVTDHGSIFFEPTGEFYKFTSDAVRPRISAWDIMSTTGGPVSLLAQNRNWIAVVCGPTGTGKSYTALRICEMLNPKFKVDNVAFSIPDLIDLFEASKAGDFLIFDEGNEWNAREAQKKENILFSKILAMLRFTQISVLFTLPHMGMIDINGRRVMHSYLYSIIINRHKCPPWQRTMSGVYWYNIISTRLPKSNQTDIPLLYKFPVINEERVSKVWFKKASDGLLREYEEIKRTNWNNRLISAKKMSRLSETIEGNIPDLDKQIERAEKIKEKQEKTKTAISTGTNVLKEIMSSEG